MGIYPNLSYKEVRGRPGAESQLHVVTEIPGYTRTVIYAALAVVEERTNCFCCSCGEYAIDPACRNHGWAATRPCGLHGMPGQTWQCLCDLQDEDRPPAEHDSGCPVGQMPDPVNPRPAEDAKP